MLKDWNIKTWSPFPCEFFYCRAYLIKLSNKREIIKNIAILIFYKV